MQLEIEYVFSFVLVTKYQNKYDAKEYKSFSRKNVISTFDSLRERKKPL